MFLYGLMYVSVCMSSVWFEYNHIYDFYAFVSTLHYPHICQLPLTHFNNCIVFVVWVCFVCFYSMCFPFLFFLIPAYPFLAFALRCVCQCSVTGGRRRIFVFWLPPFGGLIWRIRKELVYVTFWLLMFTLSVPYVLRCISGSAFARH